MRWLGTLVLFAFGIVGLNGAFYWSDGRYARSIAGSDSRRREPDVRVEVIPARQSVRSGHEVVIDCRASGGVDPRALRWTKIGGPLPRSAFERDGRLTIPSVQPSDSGAYVCTARHGRVQKEARATLQVQSYGLVEQRGRPRCDPRTQKTCQDGGCVDNGRVCDGVPDCADRSDELNCPGQHSANCQPNEMKCNNGRCVQKMWICDGDDDCGDRTDESTCRPRKPGDRCDTFEFECKNRQQCVPASFHCDGENDCQDGSDEVGCVQPTVTEPPPSGMKVQLGETFILRCRAIGVPVPHISWRKNWGHVCPPPRCTQTSEGGFGVLTVRNAITGDSGAYTCEALNTRGRVLAVPDCIVEVGGPPTPPPVDCNKAGTARVVNGRCECKAFVTGRLCDQCALQSFWLNAANPQGCLRCFCSGVTQDCSSSTWYRTQIRYTATDDGSVGFVDGRGQSQSTSGVQLSPRSELSYRGPAQTTTYLTLPKEFLNDQISAYGGDLKFTVRYSGGGSPNNDAVVKLRGNEIVLLHRTNQPLLQDRPNTIVVPMYEISFQREDGQPCTREHLLMTLADLEALQIKLTYLSGQSSVSLSEITLDVAADRRTGLDRAWAVEQCRCPAEYVGLSCEDCAPGYKRSGGGLYLGTCVEGPGDCNPIGTLRIDPGGRCVCKKNVIGERCDICTPPTFFLDNRNPHGCIDCFCSGVAKTCESSDYYRIQITKDFGREGPGGLKVRTKDMDNPIRPRGSPRRGSGRVVFDEFGDAPNGKALYWELPTLFHGDRVTAYGGGIKYKVSFSGTGAENREPDVVIRGNNIVLYYYHWAGVEPDMDQQVTVNMYESNWRQPDGNEATRPQLMMALSDLDTILLKISYRLDMTSSTLVETSMDISKTGRTVQERALAVEFCKCPEGYIGSSCEDCAPGFNRNPQGNQYLGTCTRGPPPPTKCRCNGHSEHCNEQSGECYNCRHNTEGFRCDRCKPGYVGDARSPQGCRRAPPRCRCNGHSTRCDVSAGRCYNCQHYTEGFRCGKCKAGYYGDATRGTPNDCQQCPCPPGVSCSLGPDRQVTCLCPAGYMGRRCTECAPGYSRDRSDPRVCLPVVPTVLVEPPVLSVPIGGTGTFRCSLTGKGDNYFLDWIRPGHASIQPNADSKPGVLTISRVSASDVGEYKCTASPKDNGVPPGQGTGRLEIKDAPRIVVTPPYQDIPIAGTAQFKCSLSGGDEIDYNFGWARPRGASIPPHATARGGDVSINGCQMSDSGDWICTATPKDPRSGLTAVSGKGVLGVINPVRIFVEPPFQEVPTGSPAEFTCSVSGAFEKYDFEWDRPGAAQLPSTAVTSNGKLSILSVQPGDSGVYQCTGKPRATPSTSPSLTATGQLQVSEAPRVVVDPPVQSVPKGGTGEFHCSVRGTSEPYRFEWSRPGSPSLPPGAVQTQDGMLLIHKVDKSYAGEYVCSAVPVSPQPGRPPLSGSGRLNVDEPDRVVVEPPEQSVPPGQPATFRCYVAGGNQNYDVNWNRPSTGRLPAGATDRDGVLTINSVDKSMEDRYECTATPKDGSGRPPLKGTGKLDVNEPPSVTVTPPVQDIPKDGTAQFTCNVPGNYDVKWRKRGQPGLPPNAEQRGNTLILRGATGADAGDYECIATPRDGGPPLPPGKGTLRVSEPARVRVDPPSQEVPEGSTAQFRCSLEGGNPQDYALGWTKAREGRLPSNAAARGGDLSIRGVTQSNAGDYECTATPRDPRSGLRPVSDTGRLGVTQPARVEITPPSQTVPEGSPASFDCHVSGGDPRQYRLGWSKAGQRGLPNNVFANQGQLSIREAEKSHAGDYQCTATPVDPQSGLPPLTGVGKLGVDEPAKVEVTPPSQTVPVGSPATFDCRVTGADPRDYRLGWSKAGQRGLPNSVFANQGQLSIREAERSHAGDYRCTATPVDPRSGRRPLTGTGKLAVEEPAKAEVTPPSQNVPEGSPASFDCRVTGADPRQYSLGWNKAGQRRLPSNVFGNQGQLSIREAEKSHAGDYECTATPTDPRSGLPPLKGTGRLGVDEPAKVEVTPPSQTVPEGSPASFDCRVTGTDARQYNLGWNKAGQHGLPSNVFGNQGQLSIREAEKSHAGDYECTATPVDPRSGKPPLKGTGKLGVEEPAKVEVTPPSQNVPEGSPASFDCSVTGTDPRQYNLGWNKAGQRGLPSNVFGNQGQLSIREAEKSHAGDYECTATPTDPRSGLPPLKGTGRLGVDEPARVEVTPPSQTVPEGSPASFDCRVVGTDPRQYRLGWGKAREHGLPNGVTANEAQLSIRDAQLSHAGDYECTATPIDPRSGLTPLSGVGKLDVTAPAQVKVDPPEQEVPIGDSAGFQCTLEAPNPQDYSLGWRKAGEHGLPQDAQAQDGSLSIQNAQPFHEGDYECMASPRDPRSGLQPLSGTGNLKVTSPDEVVVDPPGQSVPIGDTAEFSCTVPNAPPDQYNLNWKRGDSEELPPGSTEDGGILTIPVQSADVAGEYVCEASDPDEPHKPPLTGTGNLDVPDEPKLKIDPPEQTVPETGTAVFRCTIDGDYDIVWNRPGHTDLPDNVEDRAGTLIIRDAKRSDAGDYECVATPKDGGPPVTGIGNLDVAEPPQVIVDPPEQTIQSGDTATFKCRVEPDEGDETDYTLSWDRPDHTGLPRTATDTDGVLTIEDAQTEDAGDYECTASTPRDGPVGSAPGKLNVAKKEVPQVEVDPEKYRAPEGEAFDIQCTAISGIPDPTLSWSRADGSEIEETVVDHGDGRLEFSDFKRSQRGEYVCTGKNIAGTATASSEVKPKGIDITIDPPPPTVEVPPNTPVELTCSAEGDPQPTVEWDWDVGPERGDVPKGYVAPRFEGDKVYIDNFLEEHKGLYTCTATNGEDTAEESISLVGEGYWKHLKQFQRKVAALHRRQRWRH